MENTDISGYNTKMCVYIGAIFFMSNFSNDIVHDIDNILKFIK